MKVNSRITDDACMGDHEKDKLLKVGKNGMIVTFAIIYNL